MAAVNPPFVMQARSDHPARLYRRLLLGVFGEGVAKINGSSDLAVTNPSGTTVRVAKGGVFIKGTDTTDMGVYFGFNDANLDFVLVAPGSNSRIDAVVAWVKDNTDGVTSGDEWAIEIVAGTADPSPTPPAIPTSAYRLANVTITSGGAVTIADTRSSSALLLAAATSAGVPAHDSQSHSMIGAKAYRNAAAGPISNGGVAIINLDAESFDSSSIHSTSSNTSRMTVPVGMGGKWLIKGQVLWDGDTGAARSVVARIKKNGGAIEADRRAAAGTADISNSPWTIDSASAGDYYELEVENNSGVSLDIFEGAGTLYLLAVYLGA